jgi:hypothetical protein
VQYEVLPVDGRRPRRAAGVLADERLDEQHAYDHNKTDVQKQRPVCVLCWYANGSQMVSRFQGLQMVGWCRDWELAVARIAYNMQGDTTIFFLLWRWARPCGRRRAGATLGGPATGASRTTRPPIPRMTSPSPPPTRMCSSPPWPPPAAVLDSAFVQFGRPVLYLQRAVGPSGSHVTV